MLTTYLGWEGLKFKVRTGDKEIKKQNMYTKKPHRVNWEMCENYEMLFLYIEPTIRYQHYNYISWI